MDEPQPSTEHTHWSLRYFLVNFKIGVLVKKKTLQEPVSIQVDLNQGIKEGLIL